MPYAPGAAIQVMFTRTILVGAYLWTSGIAEPGFCSIKRSDFVSLRRNEVRCLVCVPRNAIETEVVLHNKPKEPTDYVPIVTCHRGSNNFCIWAVPSYNIMKYPEKLKQSLLRNAPPAVVLILRLVERLKIINNPVIPIYSLNPGFRL